MIAKYVDVLGKVVGVVTGAALAAAWAFAMWVPTQGVALTGISFVVALLMALVALFAAIASFYGHFVVVVLAFLASFFPVGVALVTADHWFQWVGRLDFGLLLAAVLMWLGSRKARTSAAAPAEQP